MQGTMRLYCLAGIMMFLLACEKEDDMTPFDTTVVFQFENDLEGWEAGFADLPQEGQDIYELDYGHAPLPSETGVTGNGFFIQGHNRSDDLFMFIKRKITGLESGTKYQVRITISLASQDPSSSFGIGGSPGSSVYLKAGFTDFEPLAIPSDESGTPWWHMNLDKGNQSQEGEDMKVLGTIGIPGDEFEYRIIERDNHDRLFELSTNPQGELWAIIGTDSGFEGLTRLYYHEVKLEFRKKN